MNKQYRPLEVGEYLQLGDELRCIDESINPGRKWYKVKASEFGYQIEKDSAHDFRRPISLSTDTEALASKMADKEDYPFGAEMLDAVADAPSEWGDEVKKSFDDMMLTGTGVMDSGKHVATSDIYLPPEQSEPDWGSAPEGATHVLMHDIHGASWRRKGGFDSWYYWDEDKWVFMGEGGFIADEYIERPRPEQSKSTEPVFTTESDKADQKLGRTLSVYEQQEQEWNGEGLPPVGVECEVRFRHPGTMYSEWYKGAKFKAGYDYKIWFCAEVESPFIKEMVMPSHDVQFRPIQSTAERKREEAISAMMVEISESHTGDSSEGRRIATDLYNAGYRLKVDE